MFAIIIKNEKIQIHEKQQSMTHCPKPGHDRIRVTTTPGAFQYPDRGRPKTCLNRKAWKHTLAPSIPDRSRGNRRPNTKTEPKTRHPTLHHSPTSREHATPYDHQKYQDSMESAANWPGFPLFCIFDVYGQFSFISSPTCQFWCMAWWDTRPIHHTWLSESSKLNSLLNKVPLMIQEFDNP